MPHNSVKYLESLKKVREAHLKEYEYNEYEVTVLLSALMIQANKALQELKLLVEGVDPQLVEDYQNFITDTLRIHDTFKAVVEKQLM